MYIPEEMKFNRFVDVKLPKNHDYFARLGQFQPSPSMYTGDDPAIMEQNKVDSIQDYLDYASQMSSNSENDG